MKKTSVYLTEEEIEGLRRRALETGKSRAELIREGVRHVVGTPSKRAFKSMGVGHGGGGPTPLHWDADDLYRSVMGREP
ncbi:MAG TPA: ribbon-helix-helix domain-containing protein [Chloroflexota bacterium]|jgi:hypothetical protein|nr:ribbon-helix-helix domain-containing protein [Chloroflexota bacterium]